MENNTDIENILRAFEGVTTKPETFVTKGDSISNNIRQLLKETYDFTKKEETDSSKSNTLPELIIQNFDLEQIWQQVELQNDYTLDKSVSLVSKFVVAKDKLLFDNEHQQESDDDDEDNDSNAEESLPPDGNVNKNDEDLEPDDIEMNENLSESDVEDEGADENDQDGMRARKIRPSAVDDEFFKLNEMNNFLTSEEQKINKTKKETSDSESEESIDLFKQGLESEEDDEKDFEGNDKLKNPRYKDFFGTKTQQRMEWEKSMLQNDNDESDENDDDVDKSNEGDAETNEQESFNKRNLKSTLELREERLKTKIKEMEKAAVSEKPWQLKGEITAENRPQNSLLEEILEFDMTSRPAPVITEATTQLLQDVIRQRIKDKAFDDVQRKEKPVETPLEYKKKLMLDQEKSKESLAQIYEKEFIKQREALNQTEKEEEEPALHKEIKTMMDSLFTKLDALSNFHFTPKPAAPELKVVSNLPAISMEEVAPVAASDAVLLAPEEIRNKTKGDDIGKGERTDTDKKRERRNKKQKQRKHAMEKKKKENAVNKLRPGLGNKYSKEKAKRMLENMTKENNIDKMDEVSAKSVKSSTAFFTQLQEEVTSHLKNKTIPKGKNKKKQLSAKQIKL